MAVEATVADLQLANRLISEVMGQSLERLVYYGCEEYAGQLNSGQPYTHLKPVVVIAILEEPLWSGTEQIHHQFVLTDRESGRELSDTLSIHTRPYDDLLLLFECKLKKILPILGFQDKN